MPYVGIRQKDNIIIQGLALFRNNRLIQTTEPLQIGVYMAAMGYKPGGYSVLLQVPEVGLVMVKTRKRTNKIRVVMENGRPRILLQIVLRGQLDERYSGDVSINTPEEIAKVEKTYEQFAVEAIQHLIEETQTLLVDIFGFGEHVRASQRQYWNQHIKSKADWEEAYSELKVDVQVKVVVSRVGMEME